MIDKAETGILAYCGDAKETSALAGTNLPTEPKAVQSWEVAVNVNGETVLTLGHNHLAGIDNIDDYADAVRTCARHLLAFIGDQEPASPRGVI